MPLQKLDRSQLQAHARPKRRKPSPYVFFMGGLRVGEGGRAIVAEEGVSRQQIKNRLQAAAKSVGVIIKFARSSPDEVVFRVTGRNGLAASPPEDAGGDA